LSTSVYGLIILEKKLEITEIVDLSFYITRKALDNKIGIILGGNVKESIVYRDVPKSHSIRFRITDDPSDNNAESLFIGDNVKLFVGENRADNGESLLSRMLRVQTFFQQVLEYNSVNLIFVLINSELYDDIEIIELGVNEFSNEMIRIYNNGRNITPSLKLIIKR
jgi:hypothetical protein